LSKDLTFIFFMAALLCLVAGSNISAEDIFLREYWMGISGNSVSDLTSDPNYPDSPTGSDYLNIFETPTNLADDYGTRVRGYIKPPYGGNYTFWISSDNQSQLWLSSDYDPANRVLIASVPDWTGPRDWYIYSSQQSLPIPLVAGQKYYIEALHKEGAGDDNLAVAWRGPGISQQVITPFCSLPRPADKAADVDRTAILNWSPGYYAASYDVYFGTAWDDVNNADIINHANVDYHNVDVNSYDPGILEFGRTYYWRVDRINNDGVWKGNIWSFTVLEHVLVDDFESYEDTNDLLAVWSDGPSNNTGSTVTLEPIVGSMKFKYDNNEPPFYSETSFSYDTPQNWIAVGVKALQLQFCGTKSNAPEQMYVVLDDGDVNSVVIHHDSDAAALNSWQFWNIDLKRFEDVNLAGVRKFCIGFGDRDNPQAGGAGTVLFDDILILPSRCLPEYGRVSDFNGDCIVDVNDLGLMSYDWLISDYNVMAEVPNINGLQVQYRFDETSGNIAFDSSGNNYHATAETNDIDDLWDTDGYDGNGCVNLDGTFALSVPNDVFVNINEQVTISVWVNADTNVHPDTIESVYFSAGPEDQNQWDHLKWKPQTPADYGNRWNHYALVKNAAYGMMMIYHNGVLVSQNTNAFQPVNGNQAGTTTIGSGGTFGCYKGKLDDFRIYNYALSQAEVVYLAAGADGRLHQPLQPVLSQIDPYQDGNVDLKDLAVLASDWLQVKLWPDW
jgi:hypothetical protein